MSLLHHSSSFRRNSRRNFRVWPRSRRRLQPVRALLPVLLPVLLGSVACRNECQELCLDMADLADECGQGWSEDAIDTCLETYASSNISKTEREICEEQRPYLQDEWNCDWLAEYFD